MASKHELNYIQDQQGTRYRADYRPLSCSNCHQYLGRVDDQADGIRLYKWRLSLCPSNSPRLSESLSSTASEVPSLSLFLASELVRLQSSKCVSRILLSPMSWKTPTPHLHHPPTSSSNDSQSSQPSSPTSTCVPSLAYRTRAGPSCSTSSAASSIKFISVWVLSPGLRVSGLGALQCPNTTQPNGTHKTASRSMPLDSLSDASISSKYSTEAAPQTGQSCHGLQVKLFWNFVEEAAAMKLQDREDTEELSLPIEAVEEIAACLQASVNILPPSARAFQGWNVGLLKRYESSS